MDPTLFIILAAYLLVQGIDILLTHRNLHHLATHGHEIPQGFEGQIDAATLAKMRDYTLDRAKPDHIATGLNIGVTVVFLFGGLLNLYNNWIIDLGLHPVLAATVFFLLLTYGETLLKIPFDLYNTFVIEERYGFNSQTGTIWLSDTGKNLAVTTLLSGLLLAGAFWLVTAFPNFWWLITWAFFLMASLLLLYIAPYVIEPLFNKFSPIADLELEKKIKDVMEQTGISISRVFTMDASKRSSHGNAYFSGIGKVKRIILFDTLIAASNHEEIVAILAHEAGHWKKKHLLKRLVAMEAIALVAFYAAFRVVEGDILARLFGLDQPTIHAKLLLAGFLGSLILFPMRFLSSYLSRRHEYEADAFAADLTGAPRDLAGALIKLGKDNLANLHPHPWYAALHYSHPPLPQRVTRLTQRKQGKGHDQ